MPVFNELGPVPMGPPSPAASLVNLSSGDHFSEATKDREGEAESSALKQGDLLCNFSNNDDGEAHPVVELDRPTGFTTRFRVASLKQPK